MLKVPQGTVQPPWGTLISPQASGVTRLRNPALDCPIRCNSLVRLSSLVLIPPVCRLKTRMFYRRVTWLPSPSSKSLSPPQSRNKHNRSPSISKLKQVNAVPTYPILTASIRLHPSALPHFSLAHLSFLGITFPLSSLPLFFT